MKTQKAEKGHLKAKTAFSYEVKKCSAQKVVYWVVLFSRYLHK